jgi:hypothetical protein
MPIPLGVLAVAGAGAAGGGGAYDLLETTVLGSDTASITFSSLGSYSAYKHLQIRFIGRISSATTNSGNLRIQFNSDTGSNYADHTLNGTGSAVSSSANTSVVGIGVRDCLPGNNNSSGIFGAAVIDLLDFNSGLKNKTTKALAGAYGGEIDVLLSSGVWLNTNAITSITLLDAGATNFVTGTRASLYGMA